MSEQTEINREAVAAAEALRRAAEACQRTDSLVANSRALLTQSRELLAELEHADALRKARRDSPRENVVVSLSETIPVGLAVHQSDQTSTQHTEFSIRVFEHGEQFGWTLYSPTREMLGSGTAESELGARIDALQAGMTYIDRLKNRSAISNIFGAIKVFVAGSIMSALPQKRTSPCATIWWRRCRGDELH